MSLSGTSLSVTGTTALVGGLTIGNTTTPATSTFNGTVTFSTAPTVTTFPSNPTVTNNNLITRSYADYRYVQSGATNTFTATNTFSTIVLGDTGILKLNRLSTIQILDPTNNKPLTSITGDTLANLSSTGSGSGSGQSILRTDNTFTGDNLFTGTMELADSSSFQIDDNTTINIIDATGILPQVSIKGSDLKKLSSVSNYYFTRNALDVLLSEANYVQHSTLTSTLSSYVLNTDLNAYTPTSSLMSYFSSSLSSGGYLTSTTTPTLTGTNSFTGTNTFSGITMYDTGVININNSTRININDPSNNYSQVVITGATLANLASYNFSSSSGSSSSSTSILGLSNTFTGNTNTFVNTLALNSSSTLHMDKATTISITDTTGSTLNVYLSGSDLSALKNLSTTYATNTTLSNYTTTSGLSSYFIEALGTKLTTDGYITNTSLSGYASLSGANTFTQANTFSGSNTTLGNTTLTTGKNLTISDTGNIIIAPTGAPSTSIPINNFKSLLYLTGLTTDLLTTAHTFSGNNIFNGNNVFSGSTGTTFGNTILSTGKNLTISDTGNIIIAPSTGTSTSIPVNNLKLLSYITGLTSDLLTQAHTFSGPNTFSGNNVFSGSTGTTLGNTKLSETCQLKLPEDGTISIYAKAGSTNAALPYTVANTDLNYLQYLSGLTSNIFTGPYKFQTTTLEDDTSITTPILFLTNHIQLIYPSATGNAFTNINSFGVATAAMTKSIFSIGGTLSTSISCQALAYLSGITSDIMGLFQANFTASVVASVPVGTIITNVVSLNAADGLVFYMNGGITYLNPSPGLPQPSKTPPTGFVLCNGCEFNQYVTSAALVLALKGSYGTHLPDFRGAFLRGNSNGSEMAGSDGRKHFSNNLGQIQYDNVQSHQHHIRASFPGSASPQICGSGNGQATTNNQADEVYTDFTTPSINCGDETIPMNFAVNYFIKY